MIRFVRAGWIVMLLSLQTVPLEVEAQAEQITPRRLSRPGSAQVLAIEGEALVSKAAASAGTLRVQAMERFGQSWSGGAQLFWTGAASGAVLDLPIEVPSAAVYALELYFTRAPDYGQVQLAFDGQPSSLTLDAYAPRVTPPGPAQAGQFVLQAGTRTLSVKLIGKHPQSSGMRLGLDQVKLYPVAAVQAAQAVQPPPGQPPRAAGRVLPPADVSAQPGAGGAPAAPPKTPGPDCESTCLGDTSSVYRKTEIGSCQLWFRIPCNPYTCDSTLGVCRETCVSDQDCSAGGKCSTTTGLCAAMPVTCQDNQTLLLANRQSVSCSPYACNGAACRSTCSLPMDCAAGYTCNSATGMCVKKP